MQRRHFLLATAALSILPQFGAARSDAWLEYREGLVRSLLEDGETVFLDFWASWCATCRAQERVVSELLQQNPAYEANIRFVVVDWDVWSRHAIATNLRIPRRSTLVMLRGNRELGRVVAETKVSAIKELLDLGLA